ncbi:hypothetical protein B0A48_09080 [Cryoendolithus antarcticus]|uniref:Uncharacterized protein n=1 Tax=Cryoendolithus antarcticus TaxID=1507870 RepID=A0A1V8T2B8_9PEZI|nr:hypothetical protein B0A48_09080 [Cryoendolithus antarcticus]
MTHARNISLHRDTLRAIAKVEERERKNAAGAWQLEKETLLADKAAAQARADDMSSDLDREIEMREGVEAKLQKALFDLSMSQRHVDRITDMHTMDRGDPESTARQEIQRLKEACQQAQLDITNERRRWQNEVHGLQATIQEMQGDLEEACRFKHEERADRSCTSHEGLPPPYGSLNREEYLPPYGRHKDVGKANQVNSDNAICDNFEDDLDAATGLIASNDDNSTGSHTKLVAGVLAALVEACQSIQYLHQTIDEPIDAASRAELLVNLTWRAFAAIDVRPNAAAPDRMQLTETFVLVNDVLLTVLRTAHFEQRMLDELSHYHCQVERLNQGLRQMFPAGPQAYFASSTTWLHEQICKEREMIANGSRRIARRPGSA